MKCPGCKRKNARRIITAFRGSKKIEGCENCFRARFEAHVYTGRKLWTGDEVYGRERCREMNLEFEHRTIQERTALNRRRNYGRIAR